MHTITGKTRVFGILADPIHHVKTPQRINEWLHARRIDAVMVPLQVAPPGLPAVAQGLRSIDTLGGVVVTVPHKIPMLALCDRLTPQARRIGAVNVVRREADGRLTGTMLDGEGFVAGLRRAGIEPQGRRAYLAGAGGAGRAIAFALAQAGVSALCIANRSPGKAQALAECIGREFPRVHASIGYGDPSGCELVVNSTSLGMREDDPLPLDATRLSAAQTVAEVIMEPAETALLRLARERGCRVHPGAPMLAAQVELMARFMGAAVREDV